VFIALSFSPFPFADRINFLKNYDSFNEAKPSSAGLKRFATDCCRPLLLKHFHPESIKVSYRISDSWENLSAMKSREHDSKVCGRRTAEVG
jgi:hypothetical protein